jgi:hypothetical protein
MAENPANAATPTVNLFRRLAFIVITVIGLIFLIVGGWMLISQGWDRASGTVGQCQTQFSRTQPGRSSNRVEHICDVTWQAGGASHRATVNMGSDEVAPGEIVALRVNGDQAVAETPLWLGAASAGLGALLITVAGVRMRRARTHDQLI